MFLIRWLRELVALPAVLLASLCAMLGSSWSARLIKLAWRITGNVDYGLMALGEFHKHEGPAASLREAQQWMDSSPQAAVAGWFGLRALEEGDLDGARAYLDLCNSLEGRSPGVAEMLEYQIAACGGDGAAWTEVARRLEQQRDLPPGLSKMIHTELLWVAVFGGRLDEARRRAEHILQIEDEPRANTAMWAMALRDGEAGRADRFRQRALRSPGLERDHRLYYEAAACEAVGLRDEAGEILAELRQHNVDLAEAVRQRMDAGGGEA